jgi:hypothetical protein
MIYAYENCTLFIVVFGGGARMGGGGYFNFSNSLSASSPAGAIHVTLSAEHEESLLQSEEILRSLVLPHIVPMFFGRMTWLL